MKRKAIAAVFAGLLAGAVLTGCSSSNDAADAGRDFGGAAPSVAASEEEAAEGEDESTDGTTDAASGIAFASCDEETLTAAVEDWLAEEDSDEQLFSFDGYACSGDFAATFPTIGTTEDDATTRTMVFELDADDTWAQVDREDVCGTSDPDDPTAYPDDADVPVEIWEEACNTN